MQGIEAQFKGQLESKVGNVIKKAEAEKVVYDKHCANCRELSDQIKNYMEKFEVLKLSIKESGDKFTQYQEDVELKKVETQTLESEIVSLQNALEKGTTIQNKIKDEKSRLDKQMTTMNGLKKALTLQLQTA